MNGSSLRGGDLVTARDQRWRVETVTDGLDCRFVRLQGADAANWNDVRTLLTPFDCIDRLAGGPVPVRLVGRAAWRACGRRLLRDQGAWFALRQAQHARIDVLPYQLEPALAVLGGAGCRVLLADAVGLGKTVQAGVILSELLARGVIRTALILTPPGLRDQWVHELRERFGLNPIVVDRPQLRRAACELPPGGNPWRATSVGVTSIDFVKRPEVAPLASARAWDLLVVDEAHLVSPDSDRYAAVARLAASAAFVVLVTATPHSGDAGAFEALCALGGHGDGLLMFRRRRGDLGLDGTRRIHRLAVAPSPREVGMHVALARYTAAIRDERGADDATTELVGTVLRKRALSSPESLRISVVRRLALLAAHREQGQANGSAQLLLPLGAGQGEDGEYDGADDDPALALPALRDSVRERQLLEQILQHAAAAVGSDSKLRALQRLLRRLGQRGEAAIVFTEYRDTLLHLSRELPLPSVLLHGGMSRLERAASIDAFSSGRCRLLLATDAGGTGLNLHAGCRCVVHLELPWSPVRLEQRIGRVDRIGQTRCVHAFYLLRGRSLEAGIADRLQKRTARARQDIRVDDPFDPASSSVPAVPDAAYQGTAPPSVVERAQVESTRIVHVRRLGPVADGSAPRIRVARPSPGLRLRLRGRTLVVAEFLVCRTDGGVVARHLFGLLVDGSSADSNRGPEGGWRQRTRTILRSPAVVQSLERLQVEATCALDGFTEFWSMATDRARALADEAAREVAAMYQPGLFDRRAERLIQQLTHERSELAALARRRLERYEHAGLPPTVAVSTPLVITGS